MAGTYSRYQNSVTNTKTVEIIEVDTINQRIRSVDVMGAATTISLSNLPTIFRWPKEGERWNVEQTNGRWNLLSKQIDPDSNDSSLSEVEPGDTIIPGSNVYANGRRVVRSYTVQVGDGSATAFLIQHGLGTRNVSVNAIATDPITSELERPFSDGHTSIYLKDASRFANSGRIFIDYERITYTTKTGNILSGLTRVNNYSTYYEGQRVDQPVGPTQTTHRVIDEDTIEVTVATVWPSYGLTVKVIG